MLVSEYLTSQCCPGCGAEARPAYQSSGSTRGKRCTACRLVFHRHDTAAIHMASAVLYVAVHGTRPAALRF